MSVARPQDLLACATPHAWVEAAAAHPDLLLLDHANCEKKAAATALNLMFRYGDRHPDLQEPLSRLAREELRHFELVVRLLKRRSIGMRPLSSARYAAGLRSHARPHDPGRLCDLLLIGAFIEARSCERFEAAACVLDAELAEFYSSLAAAESRHFILYLELARRYSPSGIASRIVELAEAERTLIENPDAEFRFHSGVPVAND